MIPALIGMASSFLGQNNPVSQVAQAAAQAVTQPLQAITNMVSGSSPSFNPRGGGGGIHF